jgi:dCMP deaminase
MMMIARLTAERSTCTQHFKVGAVATLDGRIVMTGYNGVPSGMTHCDDGGCVRTEDGKHAFLLHAEQNLVTQTAKLGIGLKGATVYVTHCPCPHCLAVLVQAGVDRVYFEEFGYIEYIPYLKQIQEETGIKVSRFVSDDETPKEIIDE